MKILHTILEGTNLYVFTEKAWEDIFEFRNMYEQSDSKVHLGYEPPELTVYTFLWNHYPCISFWYDSEYDMAESSKKYFDRQKNK